MLPHKQLSSQARSDCMLINFQALKTFPSTTLLPRGQLWATVEEGQPHSSAYCVELIELT